MEGSAGLSAASVTWVKGGSPMGSLLGEIAAGPRMVMVVAKSGIDGEGGVETVAKEGEGAVVALGAQGNACSK